ncbi:MAG: MauE/DoxX family redox-associated membrane protein [Cyclobacteriaceae bacterium]
MIFLLYLVAVLMISAGVNHFINPKFYAAYMPSFFPKPLANIVAGIVEIAIGLLLFLPATRSWAGLAFMVLMVIFLPLHIWDAFKSKPAIGSKAIAFVRLALQLVLIYYGWYIWLAYAAPSVT